MRGYVFSACFLVVIIGCSTPVAPQGTTTTPAIQLVLGDFCTDDGDCSVPNSQCAGISAFTPTKRCQCTSGYIDVQEDANRPASCYSKLYAAQDPDCLICEQNGGKCYDSNSDSKFNGCVCPATKSSSDAADPAKSCDTNNVTVTCNSQQMTVCYSGHRPNAFSNIHLKNREYESRCQFTVDPGSTKPEHCLDLSLKDSELSICDTQSHTAGRRLVTYQNTVIIQKEASGRTVDDIEFNAFCNFDLIVQTFSGSISLAGGQIHSEGKSIQPEVEMWITDDHYRDVAVTGILIGSKARLLINMTDAKDTYQALLPETCVATDKPSLTTAGVKSLLFLYNGCPSSEQKYLESGNSFRHIGGAVSGVVEAGPFPMFKVDDSDYVYFHCMVKVCRDTNECQMPNCGPNAGRRKRSALLMDRNKRAVSGNVAFIKSVDSAAIRVFNSRQDFMAFSAQREGEEDCSLGACLSTSQIAGIVGAVCLTAVLLIAVVTAVARRHAANGKDSQSVNLLRVTRINRSFRFPKQYDLA